MGTGSHNSQWLAPEGPGATGSYTPEPVGKGGEQYGKTGVYGARGRGAQSRPSGRFEPLDYSPYDDGWATLDEPAPPLRTTVQADKAKTVLTRNTSPDIGFDRSVNPYQGCEHGCVYCYARPTHSYYGLSAGLDFESKLFAKYDAAEKLRAALSKPSYSPAPIGLGMNTDCYQPIEKRLRLTRSILEVLNEFSHPVYIVTKSAMIVRDLDILSSMAKRDLVSVFVSVTTLNRQLARRMEPRAATPVRRIETIKRLTDAGVRTGVMVAPVIPGLTDHEIEKILESAASAGALKAAYVMLRLPHDVRDLMRDWLTTHYPERARKVMSLLHEVRGGRDNDPRFGSRMTGLGPYAEMTGARFRQACKRFGLTREPLTMNIDDFAPPPSPGDQLTLFS